MNKTQYLKSEEEVRKFTDWLEMNIEWEEKELQNILDNEGTKSKNYKRQCEIVRDLNEAMELREMNGLKQIN